MIRLENKLKLYGFNNLTKTLSFNIYDVCYAKSEREQRIISLILTSSIIRKGSRKFSATLLK